MIDRRSTIGQALRQRQRGFIINPFALGGGGGGGGGPGSHRYWRINITLADDGGSFFGLSEFILRNAGGTDLTTGGTTGVVASSEVNGSNSAANAVNGNTTTSGWISASASPPQWIAADLNTTFGSAQEVKTVDIYGSWNLPGCSPEDFDIQWSDDFSSWTTAASFTGETGWAASELRTFAVF